MKSKNVQADLFVANLVDVSPKSDTSSMEVPLFALQKKTDIDQFVWEKGDAKVVITPNKYGRATIWDKDILLYLFGQVAAAINNGIRPSRTIKATAHDILISTNRGTSGRDYEALKSALRRLRGTGIETNIKMDGVSENREFSLIQSWRTIEKNPQGNMIAVEITLSEWMYRAVTNLDILTYDRAYFEITGGLERRLYEIFRKHCGRQPMWSISEGNLYHKSGSKGGLPNFRRSLKKLGGKVEGYRFEYDLEGKMIHVRTD